MPYALSYLEHGRKPSWRYVSGPDDVTAGENYYDGDGFAHDGERLRAYSRAGGGAA